MPNPQFDYLQDLGARDYPFSQRYTTQAVNEVFSDLYIVYPKESNSVASLTLHSINFVSSTVINLVIKDGATTIIDTSAVGVVKSVNNVWSGQWRTFEYYNPNNGVHLKFILNNDVLTTLVGNSYSSMALPILNRNVECRALRVDSISTTLSGLLTGDVRIKGGSNVKLSLETDESGLRPVTRITIDAIPGEGTGNFKPTDQECSDAATTLKIVNGFGPNTFGNFLLGSTDCIWSANDRTNHEIRLHNDCRLCYDCADVFGSYENLYDLNTYAINLRKRISDLVTVYNNKLVSLKKFRDTLNVPQVTHWFTQTDYEAYDFQFRVQCGNKAIKLVTINVSYGPVDGTYTIDAVLSPYSAYYKLPTFAPQPIPGFTGGSATYDSTSSPATTKLQPGTYGYWYWNMQFFSSSISHTQVKVTWSVNLTFTDNTTQNTGSMVSLITITPQSGSS